MSENSNEHGDTVFCMIRIQLRPASVGINGPAILIITL